RARLAALVDAASASAAAQPAAIRARLEALLGELSGLASPVSEERAAQELAMLVTRADVREELDRLHAHIAQAGDLLQRGDAIGRRGFLLVLSSPSGAGKTTITHRLVERDPNLSLSVSVTTRPARPGEADGADYGFIDEARFDAMVKAGELLEHATVFGHCYGTPRRPVD